MLRFVLAPNGCAATVTNNHQRLSDFIHNDEKQLKPLHEAMSEVIEEVSKLADDVRDPLLKAKLAEVNNGLTSVLEPTEDWSELQIGKAFQRMFEKTTRIDQKLDRFSRWIQGRDPDLHAHKVAEHLRRTAESKTVQEACPDLSFLNKTPKVPKPSLAVLWYQYGKIRLARARSSLTESLKESDNFVAWGEYSRVQLAKVYAMIHGSVKKSGGFLASHVSGWI